MLNEIIKLSHLILLGIFFLTESIICMASEVAEEDVPANHNKKIDVGCEAKGFSKAGWQYSDYIFSSTEEIVSASGINFDEWYPYEVVQWPGWTLINPCYIPPRDEQTLQGLMFILVYGEGPSLQDYEEFLIVKIAMDVVFDSTDTVHQSKELLEKQESWIKSERKDNNYILFPKKNIDWFPSRWQLAIQNLPLNMKLVRIINESLGDNRIQRIYIEFLSPMMY